MTATAVLDEAGYSDFVRRHYDRLLVHVRRLVAFDDAEDIVSEAFIATWRNWERAEDPAKYLYGAARNAAKTEYAKRMKRPIPGLELEWLEREVQPEEETQGDIHGLLRELAAAGVPDTAVEVGTYLAEGQTAACIAEIMGVSAQRVSASVRQLRAGLNERAAMEAEASATSHATSQVSPQLLTAAFKRLSRREREVLWTSAHRVRPSRIAYYMGIEPNNARVTLSHARHAMAKAVGVTPKQIDALVLYAVDPEAGVGLLPNRLLEEFFQATQRWGRTARGRAVKAASAGGVAS